MRRLGRAIQQGRILFPEPAQAGKPLRLLADGKGFPFLAAGFLFPRHALGALGFLCGLALFLLLLPGLRLPHAQHAAAPFLAVQAEIPDMRIPSYHQVRKSL